MSIATEISRIRGDRDRLRTKLAGLGLARDTDGLDALTAAAEGIENRGAVCETVKAGDSYTIPRGYHNGEGTVSAAGAALDPAEVYQNTRPADWLVMPQPADDEMYLLVHIVDGASALLAFTVTCSGSYTVELGTSNGGLFTASSVATAASGDKYETTLHAADFGGLTSDGHKQAMVRVRGNGILTWTPTTHSRKSSPNNFFSWNIVEISCRLPSGTKVICGDWEVYWSLEKLRYFAWYGPNAVTDWYGAFYGCYSLTAVLQLDTSKAATLESMFHECNSLTAIPQLDTSNVTNMCNTFYQCYSLTAIPPLDTSNVTNMYQTFAYCYSLTAIPQLDTSNVIDMRNTFYYCYSLTAIPPLNTCRVEKMAYAWRDCYSLTTIPQLDTSNVIDMSGVFNDCYSLTAIPPLDTSNATKMRNTFYYCHNLTTIPPLDTSNVTDMSGTFCFCRSLTAVPQINTSKVSTTSSMFSGCSSLCSVRLDPSVTGWKGRNISVEDCSLDHSAIVDLIASLPTITDTATLTLTGNPGAAEVTDAEKTIASGKGWTLVL